MIIVIVIMIYTIKLACEQYISKGGHVFEISTELEREYIHAGRGKNMARETSVSVTLYIFSHIFTNNNDS